MIFLFGAALIPSWVSALSADGQNPDLMFDFTDDARGWANGATSNIASLLTCSRNLASYGRDASGVYTSFAVDTLRYDYSGGVRRLLVEESRKNGVRNNSMQGAVAGSPGTVPTNWVLTNGGSITRTIVGTGTENGVEYIDVRYVGSGAANAFAQWDTSTGITVAQGETHTHSVFVKWVGGSLTNLSFNIILQEATSVGGFIAETIDAFTPTTTLTRLTQSRTMSNASAGRAIGYIKCLGSGAFDVTLRFGWPQIERGAFATSPIRTTSAAVTRPADDVYMSLPAALQGLSSYTLFAKWLATANSTVRAQATLAAATTSNRITLGTNASNQLDPIVYSGGSDTYGGLTPAVSAASHKAAIAAAANDATAVMDNTTLNNDTTVTMPAANITALIVGAVNDSTALNGTSYLNSGVEQVAVWGSRRTDGASGLGLITT